MSIAEPISRERHALFDGRRMSRGDFHAAYESMPPGIRAELLGGVVRVPDPVGADHARATSHLSGLLFLYQRATPGVEVLDNASTALDDLAEVQPDVLVRLAAEYGVRSRIENDLVVGPPEFVVEVSRSTRFIDLGPKRVEYERAGVLEYVVRGIDPDELVWHVRRGDKLVPIPPDADGIHLSQVFPGLWLDFQALFNRDLDGLVQVLERGLASPEHAAFRAELIAARDRLSRAASTSETNA